MKFCSKNSPGSNWEMEKKRDILESLWVKDLLSQAKYYLLKEILRIFYFTSFKNKNILSYQP